MADVMDKSSILEAAATVAVDPVPVSAPVLLNNNLQHVKEQVEHQQPNQKQHQAEQNNSAPQQDMQEQKTTQHIIDIKNQQQISPQSIDIKQQQQQQQQQHQNPPQQLELKVSALKKSDKSQCLYMQIRPSGPPRPPFPGGMPPRPMGQPPRPGGPTMQQNMRPGGPPPPLRTMDSRGNLLMGPGPLGPRPGGPGPQNLQLRPQSGSGQQSPPAQGVPRPQGSFPWPPQAPGQQQMNRPQNPYPGNPQTRPPFARPPGQPPNALPQQQPLLRPPSQATVQPQQPPQRPSSALSNNDDDDVIMGQAITPLKSSIYLKNDPMGQSISEMEEFEPPSKNDDESPSAANTSDLSLTSPDSFANDTSLQKSTTEELISSETTSAKSKNIESSKGDNDSGVDESTQEKERNGPGSPNSPAKTPTSVSSKPEKSATTSRPPSTTPSNKSTKSRSTSRNRLLLKTPEPEPVKKVPMNKIQVGHAPSPNLKAVRSKIGSLDNASYKPGGGNVKIETKKIEIKASPRIEAKNDKYVPKGGEKKIISTKLQWNAKSKIGSLGNANHKPGGGDKKIETIKTDFKDKAKPKVGSKDNVKHQPGGGDIKESKEPAPPAKDIQTQKLEIKAQSKVGSLDNVKHKPGGGEKKIFDDKDYLKNVEHGVPLTTPPAQSPQPPASMTTSTTGADENLNKQN